MRNVETVTARSGLCTSCGICEAVCPKNCIKFLRTAGTYVPSIEASKCSDCGLCLDVCPGHRVDFVQLYHQEGRDVPADIYVGHVRRCLISHARDDSTRMAGVSGGTVAAIVKELLEISEYDGAFVVDTFAYDAYVYTKLYRRVDVHKTCKSRYVPISHRDMIQFARENRDQKIIVVGTSCAVQGFLKVISRFGLERDNYLIIGLFCDRTLSYNVFDYFAHYGRPKASLAKLIFRTKEGSAWPGIVKLEYDDGTYHYLSSIERKALKDYFQLERCLYCIDKLNQFADISVGDNYTGRHSSPKGSNSVIIRTRRGEQAWESAERAIQSFPSTITDIYSSQQIQKRTENYRLAVEKKRMTNIDIYPTYREEPPPISSKLLSRKLRLLRIGADYPSTKRQLTVNLLFIRMLFLAGRLKAKLARGIRHIGAN